MATTVWLSLFFSLCLGGTIAQAEVSGGSRDVPPVSTAPMGRLSVQRGVQGPGGLFTLRLGLLVNASKGSFGEPTSLAPDLYYAVSDTLQIGLLHTGPMGWQTLPGVSLCLTGDSGGCPRVYNNVSFDVLYGLLFGDFHLSAHTSLFVMRIADPAAVMWTVGAAGKFHFTDAVALFFDPQIGIALNNRGVNNRDALFFPVELQFQLTSPLSLKLLTGITGPLDGFGDSYRIPLGVGILANVSTSVDLGIRFSFDNLLGKQPMGVERADARSIGLLMAVRF